MSSATLEMQTTEGYGQPDCLGDAASETLVLKRQAIEVQWRRFRNGQPLAEADAPEDDIVASWRRSARGIQTYQLNAPAKDVSEYQSPWQKSLMCQAIEKADSEIVQLAEEGGLLAAVADPCGCLIWSYYSHHLRRQAERINFTTGSCWDESTVGTHAVGLCMKLQRAVTVFSCEHFQPFMHDWVSYAAPIQYPLSGGCAGILTLVTEWNRHTPLGQAAVTGLAHTISELLPTSRPKAELEIHALGQPRVLFRGKPLRLPLRQIEILCLLALNTRGMNLEAFHAALYGDAAVSSSTLKAELSHLRRQLDRQIGSRPYRLQVPVWADFIEIWQALRRKRTGEAFSLYRGPLLSQSESPELEEWRRCIDAVMGQALGSCRDPIVLMSKLCHGNSGSELVRERLGELMTAESGCGLG
ncbi:MAG: transcriptional regulator [Candidatus Thiodiazotropha sp.]